MPIHIPPDIRVRVIHYWLKGDPRDDIASQFKISTGAVSNIVNEWRNNLGSFIADDLRELSLSLKKAQISPIECTIGFRAAKMMQRFGINEEQFEYFMTEVYNKCQLLELGPNHIGEYLAETVSLSNTVFPSQIPNYIRSKKKEIENLNEHIKNMQKSITELNNKKTKEEEELNSLIENSNVSREAINWYQDIIKEIKNNGIPIDNVAFFIQCLNGIKNEGYDVNKVLIKYSETRYLTESIEIQKSTKQSIIQQIHKLESHKKFLEEKISSDLLKITKLQELERIEFGLKELKILYNTITEITREKNITPKEAIQQFFDQLNEYDKYIDLKKRIEYLNNELANLNIQIFNNRQILLAQPHIGTMLETLSRIGISEKDIADINSILFLGGFDYNNIGENAVINKESLVFELKRYRNIKSTIRSLEQKQSELTNNIKELENQKIIAETYLNFLFLFTSDIGNLKSFLKKINTLLENPRIILLCLSYNFSNDNEKDDITDI